MSDTIFDKILAGEIPADTVYEDDHVLAFRDINPQAPVHVLVIPKRRVERLSAYAQEHPEFVGQFFSAAARVAAHLDLDGPGYRLVVNNGQDGGQEVEYLHAHILGGRRLTWPPG
ncbi:MAG: histidine triad nucleotide-binding protein [Spirochaetales bacterium]|nr:histidine triad nucleotide-binding protein [Spirochaetales bacterium]